MLEEQSSIIRENWRLYQEKIRMNISRKLPSRLDSVPGFISEIVDSLNKEFPISEEESFHIKLALEESLINAIKHGNRLNPDRIVDVSVISQKNKLTIRIKDQGEGFDFDNVPDPTTQKKVMKTSGRGVFLIRKIMDEVHFSDGGREIRMVKKLGAG